MDKYEEQDQRNLEFDAQRRKWWVKPPQAMKDVMSSLLAKRGYAQTQVAGDLKRVWQEAAGPTFAKHTRPGNIRRGVLEVFVRSSTVMQQLAFQKKSILKKLQKAADLQIKDLKFRIGEIV